jgi:hypothetical protein
VDISNGTDANGTEFRYGLSWWRCPWFYHDVIGTQSVCFEVYRSSESRSPNVPTFTIFKILIILILVAKAQSILVVVLVDVFSPLIFHAHIFVFTVSFVIRSDSGLVVTAGDL